MTDLNALTSPNSEHEVFDPVNAWTTDAKQIFVSVARGAKGLIWQIGGEPEMEAYFIRFKREGEPWGEWAPFETPGGAVAPTLTALLPSSAELGAADLTLRVLGTGFTASSVIVFNGGDEPTTFVSATEVTTGVKPSLASGAATIPVLVRNGGRASAPLDFTFTEPAAPETSRTKR